MSEFLQIIIGLGVIVTGIGYTWGKFKEGKAGGKFDTVKLFKEQIDALEGKVNLQDTEMKKQNLEIKRLTAEVHDLKIVIEAKDKKLTETIAILQGRDPQMQSFIKTLEEYTELGKPVINAVSSEILPILRRLEKYLDKQTF